MLLSIHMPIWSWSILHEFSFNNNFYNSQQNKAYVYSPINEQHGVMLIIIVIIMYQYSHILFVSLIASTNTLMVNGLSVQLCGIWCESPPGELKTNWMCQLARFSSLLYRRMHEYSVHIALLQVWPWLCSNRQFIIHSKSPTLKKDTEHLFKKKWYYKLLFLRNKNQIKIMRN